MKYQERDNLVKDLRELADFIEARGLDLPSLTIGATAYVHGWNPRTYEDDPARAKRVMRRAAKAMGKAEKHHVSSYFDLRRNFGSIRLEISTPRANVCERKVVRTIEHPEETKVIPARTEEIVEWICGDPLLANNE